MPPADATGKAEHEHVVTGGWVHRRNFLGQLVQERGLEIGAVDPHLQRHDVYISPVNRMLKPSRTAFITVQWKDVRIAPKVDSIIALYVAGEQKRCVNRLGAEPCLFI